MKILRCIIFVKKSECTLSNRELEVEESKGAVA